MDGGELESGLQPGQLWVSSRHIRWAEPHGEQVCLLCLDVLVNVNFRFYKKLFKYQQILLIFSEIREKSDCIIGTKPLTKSETQKYVDKVVTLLTHKLHLKNDT